MIDARVDSAREMLLTAFVKLNAVQSRDDTDRALLADTQKAINRAVQNLDLLKSS